MIPIALLKNFRVMNNRNEPRLHILMRKEMGHTLSYLGQNSEKR